MSVSLTKAPQLAARLLRAAKNRTISNVNKTRTYLRRFNTPRLIKGYDKLHLGSGARLLPGWANIDINGLGCLVWDLRQPLPVEAGKVRFVYTEHFIEHIARADASRLFRHARNVMARGGVLRVSTPDMKRLLDDYQAGRLVRAEHGGWFPPTLCTMVNEGMRSWGHEFLYDEAELRLLLAECGFANIRRMKWGQSEHPELQSLESRPDFDDLILEAIAE